MVIALAQLVYVVGSAVWLATFIVGLKYLRDEFHEERAEQNPARASSSADWAISIEDIRDES